MNLIQHKYNEFLIFEVPSSKKKKEKLAAHFTKGIWNDKFLEWDYIVFRYYKVDGQWFPVVLPCDMLPASKEEEGNLMLLLNKRFTDLYFYWELGL